MSEQVTVALSLGTVDEAPTIRVVLQETLVGENSGDSEALLLGGAVKIERMVEQARRQVLEQITGLRTALVNQRED